MTDGARRRSLWPREHGAYAQLAAPLVTALVLLPPTFASALLAIAACSAFLANEPLLVVLGHRGKRMREQDGARATRRLALLIGIAACTGVAGLTLAPPATLAVAALVAIPAGLTILLAWRRQERTLVGEVAAAVALSGASAPVVAAAGATRDTALALWAAWALGYACTVIAVHRVIARHRTPASWRDAIAIVLLAGAATASAVLLVRGSIIGAAAPLAFTSTVLALRPPRATYLRTIGVALVIASLASGVLAWVAG